MTKEEFKQFIKKICYENDFKKVKSSFYLAGEEVMCCINLQKSNYGDIYYVNFYFFVDDYRDCKNYPTHYDADVYGRIKAMSKNATYQGKCFMTSMIEYTEYTENELRHYFEKEFNKVVLPPIFIGKKYILDNLNSLYSLTLNKEQVLSKLQA